MKREYKLEDGKYTVIEQDGECRALRYGEEWRYLTGDKLIGALLAEIDRLNELLEAKK